MVSLLNCKNLRFFRCVSKSVGCKCLALVAIVLFYRALLFPYSPGNVWNNRLNDGYSIRAHYLSLDSDAGIRGDKFLEVPQIVWGLNNQKIAFARACLTARMLNRTLLMPSLSASLFYKEVEKLQPISFDKVFQFERFNSLCGRFVRLSRFSEVRNHTRAFDLQKGSGRRWTMERDLEQLRKAGEQPIDDYEVIRIVGKNPFLWHDHWPVKDYAKVFECMVVVDEIAQEADKVVLKIREVGGKARTRHVSVQEGSFTEETPQSKLGSVQEGSFREESPRKPAPYVAVHMRIEIDWMIHCKKLEQRQNISEICSSKREIMERVGNIVDLKTPVVLYVAVADSLLEDSSILRGWRDGLLPYEKKKLGVDGIYKKYPYLIQSAIDYEVCSKADVFIGNSFSTFSSLIVLERTQRAIRSGVASSCDYRDDDVPWRSYAYNLPGESDGVPRKWMTNMSDSSLKAISYGSDVVSCRGV